MDRATIDDKRKLLHPETVKLYYYLIFLEQILGVLARSFLLAKISKF